LIVDNSVVGNFVNKFFERIVWFSFLFSHFVV
jgi:hypothetical protein